MYAVTVRTHWVRVLTRTCCTADIMGKGTGCGSSKIATAVNKTLHEHGHTTKKVDNTPHVEKQARNL